MQIYRTRPVCLHPVNSCPDLDDPDILKTVRQKYCTACGMSFILDNRHLPLQRLAQGKSGAAGLSQERLNSTLQKFSAQFLIIFSFMDLAGTF